MLCMFCKKRDDYKGVYPLCREHREQTNTIIKYLRRSRNIKYLHFLRWKYIRQISLEYGMLRISKYERKFKRMCAIDLFIKYIITIDKSLSKATKEGK